MASPGSRGGATDRPIARSLLDRLDRVANVLPLLDLGHADMDDTPPRDAMPDELGIALQALIDQVWVVVSNGFAGRQGRLDDVLVQRGKDAKNPDAVAVLVVALVMSAKLGCLPVHIPSGPPIGLTASGVPSGPLPVPMLEVDDERDEGRCRAI